MTQDTLMQRMIATGDILNPQAVFDFYHAQGSEGGGNIDLNQFKTLVDQWIAVAISGKANQQYLESLAELKADKTANGWLNLAAYFRPMSEFVMPVL